MIYVVYECHEPGVKILCAFKEKKIDVGSNRTSWTHIEYARCKLG